MKKRMSSKLNKIQNTIFSLCICLMLICANCIPYFSEDISDFDSYVDLEERYDEITEEIEIVELETDEERIDILVEEETDEIEEEIIECENEEAIEEENEVEIIEDIIIESNEIIELNDENIDIIEPIVVAQDIGEAKEEVVIVSEPETAEVATASELEEIETATASELDEVEVATSSVISIKAFWIDSMNLDKSGKRGSYNYKWDTFIVKKGEDFIAPDNVIKDIKHSSCDQVYEFVGFTTEDQKTKYWLYADYDAGEKMFDKTFPVETDLVVWAVYEAKDTYVSSIKLVDGKLTFKTTTIPNIAIKNIIVSEEAFENLKSGYKVLKNGGKYIAYSKDSEEGKPILETDVKKIIEE